MCPFKTGMQLKYMGKLSHLDEHALGAQLRTLRAQQPCRQSRELLYSIPAALCDLRGPRFRAARVASGAARECGAGPQFACSRASSQF